MKHTVLALLAFSLSASAFADLSSDGLIGKFELKMGRSDNSLVVQLECESESNCTLTSVAQWKRDPPRTDKQVLREVVPVKNLVYATNALKYAIDQQSRTIKNEEYSQSMSRLRPIFSSNPSIAKCWDLNYPSPDYMLACTLTDVPPEGPPIYLFGTLLANCGEAFCRYVINPMTRVR